MMWYSDNPRDNLIALAVLTGILAATGIVHLIKKQREKQNEESRRKQRRQSVNIPDENIIHLNKNGRK